LRAARSHGMRTAFVPRPREYGPGQTSDLTPEEDWDVVARDFGHLATVMKTWAWIPRGQAQGSVFWNRKRAQQPLSVKAIQKKMERYAKAAGITASCQSLRPTFASNLLEHGAEVVAMRDFLGHSQIASSER
jgi:hypothetical protein